MEQCKAGARGERCGKVWTIAGCGFVVMVLCNLLVLFCLLLDVANL